MGGSSVTSCGERGTVLVADENVTTGSTTALIDAIAAGGWESVIADDLDRLRWLASVRNFGAIVLRGTSRTWIGKALATVRAVAPVPVIALTSNLDEIHAQLLDGGADLVLGVSCRNTLLHSAIESVVRKRESAAPELRHLDAAGIRVDLSSRETSLDGRLVDLTPTEFRILQLLMTRAQTVVPHDDIIRSVWNWKYIDGRNALRLQLNRLRSKIEVGSDSTNYIRSVHGVGYTFTEPVSQYASAGPGDGTDSTAVLLHGRMRSLISLLNGADSRAEACRLLVTSVVSEGLCDSSAVFVRRGHGDRLMLMAQAGMSEDWQSEVAVGLPLAGRFMASQTVTMNRTLHYVDIASAAKRLRDSARLLSTARLSAQLSVPLGGAGTPWGQIGFGRRSDSPFTPMHCMVLETAATLLGAIFADEPGTPVRLIG